MKELKIKTNISDEDYEAFKNNMLHIRVYCRKDGDVLCVTVPIEKQDMLDREMFASIRLRKLVNGDII